jgi:hypothetical protein
VPVVAGGRVFGLYGDAVVAFPAAGCGRPSCPATWTRAFGDVFNSLTISGADASTLFVTYTRSVPNGRAGALLRLSASTGAVQWSVTSGLSMNGLVRGGGAVWLFDEYVSPSGSVAMRILGFSATATGAAPLRTLAVPTDEYGFPMTLAVAGGTLFHQTWRQGRLVGYRVAGT